MFDAMLPFRFAQAATELAVRNTTLAMSFWADCAQQSMAMWSPVDAVPEPVRNIRTVRSWYRHPDQPSMPFGITAFGLPGLNPFAAGLPLASPPSSASPFVGSPFSPATAMQPWMAMMKAAGAAPSMMRCMYPAAPLGSMPWQAPMQAPIQAWMKMWSNGPVGMAASPMAFALMAFGVPQSAAWPTAEAGAHAMEASRKAAEGMEQMFSTYRSSGGHAIAQIIFAGRKLH